jgi:hypothetical protein
MDLAIWKYGLHLPFAQISNVGAHPVHVMMFLYISCKGEISDEDTTCPELGKPMNERREEVWLNEKPEAWSLTIDSLANSPHLGGHSRLIFDVPNMLDCGIGVRDVKRLIGKACSCGIADHEIIPIGSVIIFQVEKSYFGVRLDPVPSAGSASKIDNRKVRAAREQFSELICSAPPKEVRGVRADQRKRIFCHLVNLDYSRSPDNPAMPNRERKRLLAYISRS